MKKQNFLLEKVIQLMTEEERGRVLDLGCGDGKTGKRLLDEGFKVDACDMDAARFEFKQVIPFKLGNLNDPLPYANGSFDYVILMEVIEHIYNPDFVMAEISRILRKGGKLILSTPNILNIGSRCRFLIEGSYDFFREPTLDFSKCFPAAIQNMHVIPWRYQELEYLLSSKGLETKNFYVDKKKMNFYVLMLLLFPVMYLSAKNKEYRSKKTGSVDYSRMNRILLSSEMLLGRHLILSSIKQ
jgi:SAM-dependent methyltransferase